MMSVDPKNLRDGDVVVFGGRITKAVDYSALRNDPSEGCIWLSNGMRLVVNDKLWELAELVKPELPTMLSSAELSENGTYSFRGTACMPPEQLLHILKRDVEELEKARVTDIWRQVE